VQFFGREIPGWFVVGGILGILHILVTAIVLIYFNGTSELRLFGGFVTTFILTFFTAASVVRIGYLVYRKELPDWVMATLLLYVGACLVMLSSNEGPFWIAPLLLLIFSSFFTPMASAILFSDRMAVIGMLLLSLVQAFLFIAWAQLEYKQTLAGLRRLALAVLFLIILFGFYACTQTSF
jgi:hypothetical protein